MFSERVHTVRSTRRADTKAAVLAHAESLYRTQGFAATTVRQIATAAGVSVGTVIGVGDKSALLVRVFDDWIAQIHAAQPVSAHRVPADSSGPVSAKHSGKKNRSPKKTKKETAQLSPADAITALLAPFVDYFAADTELLREYSAVVVRGHTQAHAVFGEIAGVLTAEIAQVLRNTAVARSKRRARVIYLVYVGALMSSASGECDITEVLPEVRSVVTLMSAS